MGAEAFLHVLLQMHWTVPWRPGGSKYARNPPLPDVQISPDFGRTPY